MKTSMLTLAMWCAMTTAMAQTYQVPVSEAHEQMLAGKYEPTWQSLETHQTKKFLYATAMGWPEDGRLVIKSLAKGNPDFKKSIKSVYLLGYGKLKATQTTEGLVVNLPQPCNKIAPVLRITK